MPYNLHDVIQLLETQKYAIQSNSKSVLVEQKKNVHKKTIIITSEIY